MVVSIWTEKSFPCRRSSSPSMTDGLRGTGRRTSQAVSSAGGGFSWTYCCFTQLRTYGCGVAVPRKA